jgi:Mn-containing catalase
MSLIRAFFTVSLQERYSGPVGLWLAVGSGNTAADMYANVMAKSTGRVLATCLWEATDDPGMKDMLAFLIARDTIHQNQWLAVIEELDGLNAYPIPNSFPQSEEVKDGNHVFVSTCPSPDGMPQGRWPPGTSMDSKGGVPRQKSRAPGRRT